MITGDPMDADPQRHAPDEWAGDRLFAGPPSCPTCGGRKRVRVHVIGDDAIEGHHYEPCPDCKPSPLSDYIGDPADLPRPSRQTPVYYEGWSDDGGRVRGATPDLTIIDDPINEGHDLNRASLREWWATQRGNRPRWDADTDLMVETLELGASDHGRDLFADQVADRPIGCHDETCSCSRPSLLRRLADGVREWLRR